MRKTALNYELYGELLAGRATDSVHVEPIRERSSKHNWTIRLHQHKSLGQIFLFKTSGVRLSVGQIEHMTTQPTFLVVPPGVSHGFRFDEDVVGDVVSVRLNEMSGSLQKLFMAFSYSTAAVFPASDTDRFEDLEVLVRHLTRAYRSIGPHRDATIASLVDLILLYLSAERANQAALVSTKSTGRQSRKDNQVDAFCALLEENFANAMSVLDYAQRVGLSAPQLSRICRETLGQSPNSLVRHRRLLEAKRLLEYTDLQIAEISERCGFRDPAFFSRTFKAEVGVTAKAFRAGLDR